MMNLDRIDMRVLMVLAFFSTGSTPSIVGPGSQEGSGRNLIMTKTAVQAPAECNGDIVLRSQAQVDAFPATYACSVLTGALTISGNDIANLDSLYALTKVGGNLLISDNPSLVSLSGLSSLSYVGLSGGGS